MKPMYFCTMCHCNWGITCKEVGVPPIFTKQATKVRSEQVWSAVLFGGNPRSISYWHYHIIFSKYAPLNCIQAYKCVCHSLIAGRVFLSSAWKHSEFIPPDETASTWIWWHTLPVAISAACLPVVCSKCRWTEETSAGRSILHGTYC